MPSSTVKPCCSQDVGQISGGLDFLKAELAVAEDGVDHLLREIVQVFDTGDRLSLESVLSFASVLGSLARAGAAAGALTAGC